jgi:hypothetical protein
VTVVRRSFAPSLRRVTSAPSTRRALVLTLLYGNAIVAGILALVLVADAVFDFLKLGVPIGARLAKVASLSIWAIVNSWVGKQVFDGARRGYRYGLMLFGLLLAQEILVDNRTAIGIVLSLLCVAALASIRDELTS